MGHRYGPVSVGRAADARLLGSVLLDRPLPTGDGSGLRVALVRDPFWADRYDGPLDRVFELQDQIDSQNLWDIESQVQMTPGKCYTIVGAALPKVSFLSYPPPEPSPMQIPFGHSTA